MSTVYLGTIISIGDIVIEGRVEPQPKSFWGWDGIPEIFQNQPSPFDNDGVSYFDNDGVF